MNDAVRDLIGSWVTKQGNVASVGGHDPFERFFRFYLCLDAWLTTESGEENFEGKLAWLLSQEKCLVNSYSESGATEDAQMLKQYSPVEDMRPRHRGQYSRLHDPQSLEQVAKFIYQIRCNLFHGAKSPREARDIALVEVAGRLLEKWIRAAYQECLGSR